MACGMDLLQAKGCMRRARKGLPGGLPGLCLNSEPPLQGQGRMADRYLGRRRLRQSGRADGLWLWGGLAAGWTARDQA